MTRGGARAGAGRPRLPTDERRGTPPPIKTTPTRIAAWQEAAARQGLSLTDWMEIGLDALASGALPFPKIPKPTS